MSGLNKISATHFAVACSIKFFAMIWFNFVAALFQAVTPVQNETEWADHISSETKS